MTGASMMCGLSKGGRPVGGSTSFDARNSARLRMTGLKFFLPAHHVLTKKAGGLAVTGAL